METTDKDKAKLLLTKARKHNDAGQFEESITVCQEALGLDNTLARAWNCMGASLAALQRHKEAIDCYKKAVKLDPKLLRAWYNLGNRYWELGQREEALSCYRKTIELEPREDDDRTVQDLAHRCLQDPEWMDRSIKRLNEAFRMMQPQNPEIVPNPEEIKVSEKYGRVKERFEGTDGRLWVLLQNIPNHPEVQKNHVENLRTLLDEYQFHLILVEGNRGTLIAPNLRAQPKEWKEKFAKENWESGYYGAEEYLYLTREVPPTIIGVDGAEIAKEEYHRVHLKFLMENRSPAEDVFKQLREAIASAEETLYRSTLQTETAKLDRLAKGLSYCEKLGRISLIPTEWEKYSQELAPFSIPQLKESLAETGVTVSATEEEIAFLDQYRKEGEAYYRIAIARQRAMIKNSLAELSNQGVNKAILVTGGFHTLGISRFLRANNISYVVIAPRVTQPNMPTPYQELLKESMEKHGI